MNILRITISAVFIFMMSYVVSSAQDIVLYGAADNECITDFGSNGSSLYLVNPDTAETELVGSIGFDGVTGLAFLSRGELVGSAKGETGKNPRSAILIRIHPTSAVGSLIGVIGREDSELDECGRAPDLTYDAATNTLFATGAVCRNQGGNSLQSVNQTTGHGTIIGSYDFSGGGNGLAISDEGVLFVTIDQNFITVNPNTGAPTFIAILSIDERIQVNALAFHPLTGELFGSTINHTRDATERSSTLVKINTETGVVTEVGKLPDCFDALIFGQLPEPIPTMSKWGFIAAAGVLGIFGLLALRRRKQAA